MEPAAGTRLISEAEKVVVPEPARQKEKNILILRLQEEHKYRLFFSIISLGLKFHSPIQS